MRKLGRSVAAVVVGAAVVAAPGTGAEAVAPGAVMTCQGQEATIVGGPRTWDLEGTPGDDVIVSNGSEDVSGGEGDDVICMTGMTAGQDGGQWVGVDGGPGDDSVSASLGEQDLVFVGLGDGEDTFRGGPESDYVIAGTIEDLGDDDYVSHDSEADVIDTGARGLDVVTVGDGGPLADQVRVRGRESHVEAHASSLADGGSLRGGPGTTLALVDGSPAASGAWTLDLEAGTASLDAGPLVSWSGFGRLVWAVAGTLDVQGSDGADVVVGPVVSGDLGDGDDRVVVWSSKTDRTRHPALVDGGAGTDQVRFLAGEGYDPGSAPGDGLVPFTPGDVTVDVAARRTRFSSGEDVGLAGFEWYGAQSDGVVTLLGGPDDDVLYGSACDLRMRGGAGDDTMRQVPDVGSAGFTGADCEGRRDVTRLAGGPGDDVASAQTRRSTVLGGDGDDRLEGGGGRDRILGGPGDDLLLGDYGDDTLYGGGGTDVVKGGRGDDTCRGEYGADCELPQAATQLDPHPPGSRPSRVLLEDEAGDMELVPNAQHSGVREPAPDQTAGDVVAVRTTYRRDEVTFRTRLRSLDTAESVRVAIDIRYAGNHQFFYGSAVVVIPPRGRAGLTVQTWSEGRCRRGLDVDRAAGVVEVRLDAACFDRTAWVRSAVYSSVSEDPDSPTSYYRDEAPTQIGGTEQFGPFVWAPGRG